MSLNFFDNFTLAQNLTLPEVQSDGSFGPPIFNRYLFTDREECRATIGNGEIYIVASEFNTNVIVEYRGSQNYDMSHITSIFINDIRLDASQTVTLRLTLATDDLSLYQDKSINEKLSEKITFDVYPFSGIDLTKINRISIILIGNVPPFVVSISDITCS